MKKGLLLTSGAAAMMLFSAYSDGPATNHGLGNRTGANGGASCAGGGCHSAQSSATTGSFVSITNFSTGQPAGTNYQPGETYVVNFQGNHPSLLAWGFQAIALNGSTGIGTMQANLPGSQVPPGNNALVEHSQMLAKSNGMFEGSFKWTAPASGSGDVKFYGIINAVNGTGSASGDAPSLTFMSVTLTEQTTGIEDLATDHAVKIYPNPSAGDVQVTARQPGIAGITVTDALGKIVWQTGQPQVSAGSLSIPSRAWAKGNYFVAVKYSNGRTAATLLVRN